MHAIYLCDNKNHTNIKFSDQKNFWCWSICHFHYPYIKADVVITFVCDVFLMSKITRLFSKSNNVYQIIMFPDSKVHGANIGPTWVPDGPHFGPMNLAIRVHNKLRRLGPKWNFSCKSM